VGISRDDAAVRLRLASSARGSQAAVPQIVHGVITSRFCGRGPVLVLALLAALATFALATQSAFASPPSHTQAIDAPSSLTAVSCVPASRLGL